MVIDEVSDLVPLLVVISMVLSALVWLIKAQIKMGKQFQPNGGHSLRDSIDRLERNDDYLRHRLDQHIDQHKREG